MKRKITLWLTLLFCCAHSTSFAHDFEVDGIYYNYSSQEDKTVSVTFQGDAHNSYTNEYSGDVIIPETVSYDGTTYSVTSIGQYAFRDCTGLTSVEIPNGVTSISERAFYGCTGLTSIEIPNSVTSINRSTFYGCTGLTSVDIPNGVTSIGNYAFYCCADLTSIVIPNSVKSIGSYAFYGCTGLTSVEIPNSVTSIGSSAFYGCTGLTSVEIPNSVKSIGSSAFYGCTGLTSVVIPNSVTSIGDRAFLNCTGLTSISIPSGVTSIGGSAFYGCTGLTSIEIPNSLTSIGESAFYAVKNVLYSGSATGSPWGALNVNGKVDGYFIYADAGKTQLTAYVGRSVDNVVIPNGVTSVGINAFRGCTGLTSIELPNSVTSIGNYAFAYCTGLTSVLIPNSVTSIGDYAFSGCKLREIQVLAETPAVISASSFSSPSQYHATLLVPYGCYENYAYGGWYLFIHIKENAATTQNLSNKQAYALKSAESRSYIVYDAVNDAVSSVELDANMDEDNPNNYWQVIQDDGETYIYNIGAKKYLCANAMAAPSRFVASAAAARQTDWQLSTTPQPIAVTDGSQGISIGNSGDWLFVLNDYLAVDEHVSGIEQITLATDSQPVYNLQGVKTSSPQKGKLYVQQGKKRIEK